MSDTAERKRNLSDSSGDEAELRKLARIDSDPYSDSDSDSDSDSSSSSSSSGEESQTQETGGETQVKNPPCSQNSSETSETRPNTQTNETDLTNSQTLSDKTQIREQSSEDITLASDNDRVAVDTTEDLETAAPLTALDLNQELDLSESTEKDLDSLSASESLGL